MTPVTPLGALASQVGRGIKRSEANERFVFPLFKIQHMQESGQSRVVLTTLSRVQGQDRPPTSFRFELAELLMSRSLLWLVSVDRPRKPDGV